MTELKNRVDVLLVRTGKRRRQYHQLLPTSTENHSSSSTTLSMAKRTLTTCWKQFEKLSLDYLGGEKDCAAIAKKLEELTSRTNADKIGGALETLFIRPHITQKVAVKFSVEFDDGEIPIWQTRYDAEADSIIVHPLSIFKFISDIRKIVVVEHEDDFVDLRYTSFLYELGKMSSVYLLFLLMLQRVAYLLEIAHLEKRGGVVEVAEGEAYHTLLWAFKELEGFAQRTRGDSVRAMFAISWYESDWITGR